MKKFIKRTGLTVLALIGAFIAYSFISFGIFWYNSPERANGLAKIERGEATRGYNPIYWLMF